MKEEKDDLLLASAARAGSCWRRSPTEAALSSVSVSVLFTGLLAHLVLLWGSKSFLLFLHFFFLLPNIFSPGSLATK